MADRVTLTVDGLDYAEWTQVEIRRSLEEASASFSLSVAERAARLGPPLLIRPGSECVVSLDDGQIALPVVTGYVDDAETSTSASSHDTSITGRSRTADIIDCQADIAGTYHGPLTLFQLARALCAPYNVEVDESPAGCSGAAFDAWKVEPDETVFASIERAARLRGCLLVDDAEGRLVIKQITDDAYACDAALTMPGNVEEATLRTSAAGLYSHYEVIGQSDGREYEAFTPALLSVHSIAEDTTLGRYRLRRTQAEARQTAESVKTRARWEAATRAGRATLYNCTVGTWRIEDGGGVWSPGMIVHVADQYQGVDADLLLVDVSLTYGIDGTRASLSLAPIIGYLAESPVEYEARVTKKKGAKKAKPQAGIKPWEVTP